MTGTADPVRRWAEAQAATVTAATADAARGPSDAPAQEFPREPVPAVIGAVTEVRTWDGAAVHVNRAAWSRYPDGRPLLATVATDGIARIWDPETGGQLHVLRGHNGIIGRAEWGLVREQPLLATGGVDGTARIWEPGTGSCLLTLNAHNPRSARGGSILIAWGTGSEGQPVLATGDQSGVTRIWDPSTGQELYEVPADEPDPPPASPEVFSMAWGTGSGGQARLATARNRGGMLNIWDPGTGQLLYASSPDRGSATHALAYGRRADGQPVLASADVDAAHVLTERDGTFTSESVSVPEVTGGVGAVSWSPLVDGRLLLAVSTGVAVHLYDGHTLERLYTGELSFSATGPGRLDWTLTPDGRLMLAVASARGQIHLWDVTLDPPAQPPATWAQPSAAAAPGTHRPQGSARLVLPPREVTPQFPEAAQIEEATISLACAKTPGGRTLLATTGGDEAGDIQLWDLESGRHLRTLTGHSKSVWDVAWAQTADGRQLLASAGTQDRTARIWDPETGRELRTLTGTNGNVYTVSWGTRRDGTLLLATGGADRTVRIWDPETGQELRSLTGHTDQVVVVAFGTRSDGTLLLASSSLDRTARIWDPETGRELRTLATHNDSVYRVAWGTRSDGTLLLASSSLDGTARIWNAGTGNELGVFPQSDGERGFQAVDWGEASDGRLLLAAAGYSGTARVWDAGTGAEVASLPGPGSPWRSVAWTRDLDGNLLLLLANSDPGSGPVRAWLVETGPGQAEPRKPGRPGTRRAAQASRQLLRLGAGGLWLPLGPLTDLVTLTAPGDQESSSPGAGLHDKRLAVLAEEPGIARLRGLAAGQPPWGTEARAAFAALLSVGLDIPAQYAPPGDTAPGVLATALATALAALADAPAGAWRAPVAELRAAAGAITDQVITLLSILGPQACAADPLLPLRLARHAPELPALTPRQFRLLANAGTTRPTATPAALGTLTYSPGTAGVTRHGPATRLLPTQLALPADLLAARLAEDQLLYRQHRAPAPPAPVPVTVILDTTPPAYGPAGNLLRLAAHLITATLWAHGHHPHLITLDAPATTAQLHSPGDLIQVWTATTLGSPATLLATARQTAASLGQPALLLTHHHTARDNHYPPGPATRLLTTHQPPEKPPPEPATPWHSHLPPNPAQAQLTTAINRLLTPADERR